MNAAILKCILLAQGYIDVSSTPIDEYAMATLNRSFKGTQLEATVVEGKLNSVKLTMPKYKAESFNYSIKDYEQKSLSTKLTVQNEFTSVDCEITN